MVSKRIKALICLITNSALLNKQALSWHLLVKVRDIYGGEKEEQSHQGSRSYTELSA